ncbi:MAG: hypothetical protein Q7T97_09800 [Burkholderiaceae bacterium]|nr:hypothetical protein [Burkholderiaceae bacterium]
MRIVVPHAIRKRHPELSGRAEEVNSDGRSTARGGLFLYLTPMHGKAHLLKPLIANIHAALQHVKAAAEQLRTADPWAILLRYVSDKIAPTLGPFRPPVGLQASG